MNRIPFHKVYICGTEEEYISRALHSGHLAGNGKISQELVQYIKHQLHFKHILLTPSCTAALEMMALLLEPEPDDEIIIPSYTFVSTANAFASRGFKVILADSEATHPNISPSSVMEKITPRTRAILAMHYGGVSCNMESLQQIADQYNLILLEDAAHGMGSQNIYNQHVGQHSDMACFSFHETKNITCGEGGMLVINNENFVRRSEIIWDKGTDRCSFLRGEISSYTWRDKGSSFLMPEISASVLYAQLHFLNQVNQHRIELYNTYRDEFSSYPHLPIELPEVKKNLPHNAHIFYIVTENSSELKMYLHENEIGAAFHYPALHLTPYYLQHNEKTSLPHAEKFSSQLLRLPLYFDMTFDQVKRVVRQVAQFYDIKQVTKSVIIR